MSWWVSLEDEDGTVRVANHREGGVYALGGMSEAELNVTYNYGEHFWEAWPEDLDERDKKVGGGVVGTLGLMLDGRTAMETSSMLHAAVAELGDNPSGDYWEATPGNAGHALAVLMDWAEHHPHAVWRVT